MNLGRIAEACGVTVSAELSGIVATGVSTDTRTLAPGDLFVALRGETHDGHDYVQAALDAGACAVVVSDAGRVPTGRPAVVVADTLIAFGRIAAAHRAELDVQIAAVTGSVAKTTTKNIVATILAEVGETLSAPGTHNNEVGVPQTLLALCPSHRFAVLELAMRGVGEISWLAELVRPQVGLITNIGESHVGRLGSREAIARAKAELFEHLPPDGRAILNHDDFYSPLLAEMSPCPVLSFGMSDTADYHARNLRSRGLAGADFTLVTPTGEVEVVLRAAGRHNVINALAAAATAAALGADLVDIATGLETYTGTAMRLEQVPGAGGSLIINDAYNASPDSVRAALALLSEADGRRILVFGDMLELGAIADSAHREVGRQAVDAGVSWLIAVGEAAALAAEEAAARGVRADVFADADEAAAALRAELTAGDVALVKASRGMALERVVEAVRDHA
jgi:UDP-N-acetylmuramoyl-tripeptide--D-alanyl-D-alanine ligase